MAEFTPNVGLYKWNKADNKLQTITEMSKNAEKIDLQLADIAKVIKSAGTGDDTQAIKDAIASGKKHFYFPDPLYVVSDQIIFDQMRNIKITSAPDTVIKVKDGLTLPVGGITIFLFTNSSNIKVSNLTFDGNRDNTIHDSTYEQEYGIRAVNCTEITIDDHVTFINFQGDGISLGSSRSWDSSSLPIKNVTIKDCTFKNIYRNSISPIHVENVLIENIKTLGVNLVAAIDLESHHQDDLIKNVTIRNSILESGIQILRGFFRTDGSDKYNHSNFIIENCDLNGNKINITASVNVEISDCKDLGEITFDAGSGVAKNIYNNLKIVRNQCLKNMYLSKVDMVTIEDNVLENTGISGITLVDSRFTKIAKNKFINVGNGAGSHAIGLFYDVSHSSINDNTIVTTTTTKNCDVGIKLVAYSSGKNSIINNQVYNMAVANIQEDANQTGFHQILNNLTGNF